MTRAAPTLVVLALAACTTEPADSNGAATTPDCECRARASARRSVLFQIIVSEWRNTVSMSSISAEYATSGSTG